jgi:hypothetical protein
VRKNQFDDGGYPCSLLRGFGFEIGVGQIKQKDINIFR